MLREHNSVVNTFRFCLTRLARFSSLQSVKAGSARFPMSRTGRAGRSILAAGVGLVLVACAAIDRGQDEEASRIVSERARQRWDHVMKGQLEQAYEFLSPASRSTLSVEAFRKRSAAGRWWRSIKQEKVDCRGDTCQVTMLLEYDLFEIKGLKTAINETWINDAGTWWLVAGK